jgi:uncharacterized membrane protein YgdD (TMEM256/DUF423 family)
MERKAIISGAVFAALAVITGAMGAHALEQSGKFTEHQLQIWDTASRYQLYHALGLIALGIIAKVFGETKLLKASMWLFITGIVFFSGSIYLLATRGETGIGTGILGPITPLGGMLFIAGWLCLAAALVRRKNVTA